ncbi:DUF4157 domain-containing protein [Leptolyngbya sp. FACHB-261]|uniref:eCIS core domain-containing protein n=1 Tax=Leptolyngbya sp. FACHB-261 TaxID=2692806 RepID=UPI001F555913|nr:DUF4157 domain-containing protein [Leptolyngbya sp. FACHB-261]
MLGSVSDQYEQEADRLATEVVQRMHSAPSQTAQATPIEKQPEPVTPLQMQPLVPHSSTQTTALSPALERSVSQARGSGQTIPDSLCQPMERAFGADFGGVRVHLDAQADRLNRSLQARAFTTGQDIFFRQGEYKPGTIGGQTLIAHELTHVLQQSRTTGPAYLLRKTAGEVMTEKANQWLSTDADLKAEVDVLKVALREIKAGQSVALNRGAGLTRIGRAATLLSLSAAAKTQLEADWTWLVDNHATAAQASYKAKEKSFFATMKSPLTQLGTSYPASHTKYWLKNTAPQIVDIIYSVADVELPADQLYAYAQKEGLVDYVRDEIGLDRTDTPSATQLQGVRTDQSISGFDYLGLDDYETELSNKRAPLTTFLPPSFDRSKVRPLTEINEKGRAVKSGDFPNLTMAIQALAAMMKRRRKLFQDDAKIRGYTAPTQDELVYWTYVYFNVGEFGAQQQLEQHKGKRTLSDWITKGSYPNAIKLLQSYQMLRDMAVF